MHKIATAKKLMELAAPIINKMIDGGVSERELNAAIKTVELAHYLYEIEMMEERLYPHEDEMPQGDLKRSY